VNELLRRLSRGHVTRLLDHLLERSAGKVLKGALRQSPDQHYSCNALDIRRHRTSASGYPHPRSQLESPLSQCGWTGTRFRDFDAAGAGNDAAAGIFTTGGN
jgi:hypothetical protein